MGTTAINPTAAAAAAAVTIHKPSGNKLQPDIAHYSDKLKLHSKFKLHDAHHHHQHTKHEFKHALLHGLREKQHAVKSFLKRGLLPPPAKPMPSKPHLQHGFDKPSLLLAHSAAGAVAPTTMPPPLGYTAVAAGSTVTTAQQTVKVHAHGHMRLQQGPAVLPSATAIASGR